MFNFFLVYFSTGLLLVFLVAFVPIWRKELRPTGIRMGLILKILAGLLLIYTYTQIYPKREEADIFKYFDDGLALHKIRQDNPEVFWRIFKGNWTSQDLTYMNQMNYWFRAYDHGLSNDNRIIIRINAGLNLLTQGNYALNVLFFIMLSFIGSMNLFRFFFGLSQKKLLSYFCAFCIPSCVFWSSGILKEAVLVFALGCLLLNIYKFLNDKKLLNLCYASLAFVLLLNLKVYIITALCPFLIIGVIAHYTRSLVKTIPIVLGIFIMVFALQKICFPSIDILSTVQGKQFDFIQMADAVKAGSRVYMPILQHDIFSLLSLYPRGIWNVLYFPNLSMLKNQMSVASFLENLFVFILILGALMGLIKRPKYKLATMLIFGFVFLALGIIGVTTPVVGAMVRYKAPILVFFIFGLLQCQAPFLVNFIMNLKIYKWINTHV